MCDWLDRWLNQSSGEPFICGRNAYGARSVNNDTLPDQYAASSRTAVDH